MKLKHIVTICLLTLGLTVARSQEVKPTLPGQPTIAGGPGAQSAEPAKSSSGNASPLSSSKSSCIFRLVLGQEGPG